MNMTDIIIKIFSNSITINSLSPNPSQFSSAEFAISLPATGKLAGWRPNAWWPRD
jgi:hypothetical protein